MKDGKSTPEFEQLLSHLKDARGFDFTAYKRSTLLRSGGILRSVLDIGLPVEQLKQPIAALMRHGDQRVDTQIDAINRRGRQIRLHVQCVSIGAGDQDKGVIVLMQELGTHTVATRH